MEKLETVRKALKFMGNRYQGKEAEVILLAIGFQESEWKYRRQFFNGPARGIMQFEPIAVKEVLTNPSTRARANEICRKLEVDPNGVYEELEDNDVLAVCFARLLLWRDPKALPKNWYDAWDYYIRNWRPGKPRPEKWQRNYIQSINIVMENNTLTYRVYFTDENAAEVQAAMGGADSSPVHMAKASLTEAQVNDIACLKADGVALDIVPPPGEPDPECSR